MAREYKTFGERSKAFICPAAMLESLSRDEIRALSAYQHTFATAFEKLYETMDPKAADEFIAELMRRLIG